MEAIAKWDFDSNTTDILSFKKGDILKILNLKPEEPHWYLAELENKKGLVSESMIEIEPSDWFYENCKRSKAKKLLNKNPWLKFLIRTYNGQYFLSYSHGFGDKKIWHFKIIKIEQRYTFYSDSKGPKLFFSLNQLAKFVKLNGWWVSPWWCPYKETEDGVSKNSSRKAPWSPNL